MNFAVILLGVIVALALWYIYNMREGFQTETKELIGEDIKCSILKGAYDTAKSTYDNAVTTNNTDVIATSKAGMDSLKASLTSMGC